MFRKIALLVLSGAAVVGATATASQAAGQFSPLTRVNYLTFSQPAALPGVTLAPGRYEFEAGPANMNPNVVRVSHNRRIVFLGITIPATRPQGAAPDFVTFGEAPRGEARPILAWYPDGANQGHSFVYR
jgi:hypothetical protein